MNRHSHIGALALAVMTFVLAVCLSPALQAAPPVNLNVASGQTQALPNLPGDFTVTERPGAGSIQELKPDPRDQKFKILYTAPSLSTPQTYKLVYRLASDPGTDNVVNIAVEPATAAAPINIGFSGKVYEESARAIFLLFVLAVILESALALLFNWRPFVETLVPRAVKPLVAFVVAYIFVRQFDMDVVSSLIGSLNNVPQEPSIAGQILTAMVIAGGSSGVNNLLTALGFRAVRTPENATTKVPPDKAWLAVRALRGNAVGDLFVFVGPPGGGLSLLGVIKGRSKPGSLRAMFLSDNGRLPSYGGYTVQPGQEYVIEVRGKDAEGRPLVPETFGPLRFAKGSLVDIDVKL